MREALLAARGDDPLVRWSVTDRTDGELSLSNGLLVVGRNVAWRGRASRPGEHWVTGLGDEPKVVASLVAELAAQEGGQLQAVAARMKEPSGAAHLVSVCTDPVERCTPDWVFGSKVDISQVCWRAHE